MTGVREHNGIMELPRILVTGGTGFLGSEIVKKLVEAKKYEITAIDINPPALGTGTFPNVRYIRANILQLEELDKVFQEAKPSIVVHTVGLYHVGEARYTTENREAVFEVNVQGTRNVVEAARKCGARGLVYTSTIAVLGDELEAHFRNADETWPTGRARLSYGHSKVCTFCYLSFSFPSSPSCRTAVISCQRAVSPTYFRFPNGVFQTIAENHVLSSNTPSFKTCSLRSAPIFGPHDATVIPLMHGCISRWETPFVVGDGCNLVDFVYVSNVADAHILAVDNLLRAGTAAGEAFFITNGEPISARDFCIAVWKEFGHVPPFHVKIPKSVAWWAGWGAEMVAWLAGKEGTFSRGMIMDATAVRYMSIEKARQILGYVPQVGLAEALRISCRVSNPPNACANSIDSPSTTKDSSIVGPMVSPSQCYDLKVGRAEFNIS